MMKSKILFLAPFPDERYKIDGMISRIKTIDNHFVDENRSYLYVSVRKNFKRYHKIIDKIEINELNLFVHFFRIIKILFSSQTIYSHSIYMIRNIWFLLPFYNGKIILDAHGVVPEEVRYFDGDKFSYLIMSLVEKIIFTKKEITVICVTKAMRMHFINKYKRFKGKFLIYSIFPAHLYAKNNSFEVYNIGKNEVTVLYSGGNALWQKIDLMLDVIEKNQSLNINYIILTSDIEEFAKKISNRKINMQQLVLKNVSANELHEFYKTADYGFILRDDNVVNNVANPTKLIEYLFYGIIPIVISPKIGDYLDLGFEFLKVENYNVNVIKPLCKSQVNIDIANEILYSNKGINFKKNVLESNLEI